MTRRPIIFGNWKMNKTPAEAKAFFDGMAGYVTGEEAAEYGVGVPFVDLDVAVVALVVETGAKHHASQGEQKYVCSHLSLSI